MNTFLAYPSYVSSADCLDRARQGKQRLETWDILGIITDFKATWMWHSEKQQAYLIKRYRNHPAVNMWRGREYSLAWYGITMCDAWINNKHVDNMKPRFLEALTQMPNDVSQDSPSWLGDEAFHASHRSNLLRKDPVWYGQFGWQEKDNLSYIWPLHLNPG